MPNLLHIITNFEGRGGAEIMMARLVDAFEGVDQRIISLRTCSDDLRSMITRKDVPVDALGIGSVPSLLTKTRELARQIAAYQPDVILSWMYHAALVGTIAARMARHRGRNYWNIRHSLQDTSIESRNTKLAMAACKLLSRKPDGIVFVSGRAEQEHLALGWKPRASRVIHNGLVSTTATSVRARRPLIYGTAARFNPAKDYGTLLKAVEMVVATDPSVTFILAGRGVSRDNESFMQLVEPLVIPEKNLRLCGEISDMRAFYKEIDVFVLPSRTEGFGNVLIEAMASGRPCISTDTGDAADIVGDSGRIVPTQNPTALANAILTMASQSPSAYAGLATHAQEIVRERFGIQTIAAAYRDFMHLGVSSEISPRWD